MRAIGTIAGPVFSPVYPFLATKAGHEPVAYTMALVDVLRERFSRTIRTQRYQALLFRHRRLVPVYFTRGYGYAGPFASPSDRVVPMTGVRKPPPDVCGYRRTSRPTPATD